MLLFIKKILDREKEENNKIIDFFLQNINKHILNDLDLENSKHIKLLSFIINSQATRNRLAMKQWVENGGENRALQLIKKKTQFVFILPDSMLENPIFF